MTTPPEPDLATLLGGLAEGVVAIHDERVTFLNAAAAELLGTDARAAVGATLIAALRDHRLERVWRNGGREELTIRGRRVEVERIEGGLALRDVSEARSAQEDARELLAVLSHELRTPVTTIRSTLEALAYPDLEGDLRERFLVRASDEAERLVRLLEDLTVDVSPPRARSVDVASTVERAIGVLGDTLERHAVRVRRDLQAATVWADPDKVLQVVVNLLENAAVHGPDGAEVVVEAREQGEIVTLRVRDAGAPLDPEGVEALFELHARGRTAETGKGRGLGLYVVRSIAERWGGEAWGAPWHEDGAEGNAFGVTAPARRPTPWQREGERRPGEGAAGDAPQPGAVPTDDA